MKGIISTTDQEILSAFRSGKFKRQITKEQKVGIERVRRVLKSSGEFQ